jgi:hypothetical protein
MAEQYTMQDWIIAIAMNNDAFRQQLLRDPKEALERELGLSVPREVSIQVHEQTSTTLHLVLPTQTEGVRV